jgi:hypothetical protein
VAANIFDPEVLDARAEMYKAWVTPDLFPDQPQPVLKNWHMEDLIAYVGGAYAKYEQISYYGIDY